MGFIFAVNLMSKNNQELRSCDDAIRVFLEELLHTIKIEHFFEVKQSSDTRVLKISDVEFLSTNETNKRIQQNIMLYDFIKIDGVSPEDLGIKQRYLTKGQLDIMLKNIDRQKEGEGKYLNDKFWSEDFEKVDSMDEEKQ